MEYKWEKNAECDNGLEVCDCCQAEAPVAPFHRSGSLGPTVPLCKICAETFIGSRDGATKFIPGFVPPKDPELETLKEIAHIANIVLLQLGAFGAPPEIK